LRLLNASASHTSGQALADRLGVSRGAVWKRIQRLKADGYAIVGSPRRGYRLESPGDLLLPADWSRDLPTRYLQGPFHHFPRLPSTNDWAKSLARDGAPQGTVVVAETQTAGRGRLGRTWESPRGAGIYVSLILRPDLPPHELPKLTLTAAVAAVEALKENAGVPVGIKWPNDLILHGRKLGGILTEMETESDRMSHVVLGMGLNVHTRDFSPDLHDSAISLAQTGGTYSRRDLLRTWLTSLDRLYDLFLQGRFPDILARWRRACVTLGTDVIIKQGSKVIRGRAVDVSPDGALVVEGESGRRELVVSGEVEQGLPFPDAQEALT